MRFKYVTFVGKTPTMEYPLTGKCALIGGSSQGIGLASAQQLAKLGASCILVARHEEKLRQAVATLDASSGQQHRYRMADYRDVRDTTQLALALTREHPIEIVVNNTGGPSPGEIAEADPSEFLQAFEQHILASQAILQAVLPGMKATGYGRVVNIISTSVRIPISGLGVSNTIRGAMASWAKTWSNEIARYGITVNNVLPGATETPRLTSLVESRAQARGITFETMAAEMAAEIPVQRFAKAEEVAAVVAFLASPAAAYVTGTSIPVDGGKIGAI